MNIQNPEDIRNLHDSAYTIDGSRKMLGVAGKVQQAAAVVRAENLIAEAAAAVSTGDARAYLIIKVARDILKPHDPLRDMLDEVLNLRATGDSGFGNDATDIAGDNLMTAANKFATDHGAEIGEWG